MRVVGDPGMPVNRIAASWGNVGLNPGVPLISQPDIDVLVIGETHEWELVEYVRDTITTGKGSSPWPRDFHLPDRRAATLM